MGLAKSAWMEAEERGWDAPDKYVCAECFEDDHLKEVVEANVEARVCDYCGREDEEDIAAPLTAVMEPIGEALRAHFADPASAGLPRDSGEWIGEERITDTFDALETLGLACEEELFDDIARSFGNTAWYPCADGFWLHVHEHEELNFAWDRFVEEVKHRRRYFFSVNPEEQGESPPEEKYNSIQLLQRIGDLIRNLELTSTLSKGARYSRVREVAEGQKLETFAEVGAPLSDRAGAGRMNPAGISYFYLASDRETALAEVLRRPPVRAIVASFELKFDIEVLDLTRIPALPSIFDTDRRFDRDEILFLQGFTEAISKPVSKDGHEHVEYVPSQVVSEFFAEVFRAADGSKLAGMIYPSTVREGGTNLVLFPGVGVDAQWENALSLAEIRRVYLPNWKRFASALNLKSGDDVPELDFGDEAE